MSKQPSTVQTTQNSTQTVPAYASEAQQNLLNSGYGMLGSYLGLQPNQRVAGVNADQSQAYDLARQVAQGAFQTQAPGLTPATSTYTPQGYATQGYTPQGYAYTPTQAQGYSAASYDPSTYSAGTYSASTYDPRMATAQQIDGEGIRALLNPYTQDVVDTSNATLRRNYGQTAAGLGAQAAAAGSFGGSRAALQAAQLDRSFGEQVASNTAGLMSSGYDKAAGLASTNTQLRQQTELANQAAANAAAQFNAGAQNTASQFNVGAQNTANQFNAGARNTAGQSNTNALNSALQYNAGAYNTAQAADAANANAASRYGADAANAAARYGADTANTAAQFLANAQNSAGQFNTQFNAQQQQQIATLRDALAGNDMNRKLQAVALLRQIGGDQQQLLQQILNVPTTALGQYAQIVPSNYGGTTSTVGTAPNTAPSLGQQVLGAGLSIAGLGTSSLGGSLLGGLFCDARLKKDISPLGVLPNGSVLFSFRYGWEDDDAPLSVGPMAQLEEIRDPESVIEMLGIKYVTRH